MLTKDDITILDTRKSAEWNETQGFDKDLLEIWHSILKGGKYYEYFKIYTEIHTGSGTK